MPHKCVHCSKVYDDASHEILTGCTCGSKFFFYIRKEKLEQIQKEAPELTSQEKHQIEKDIREIAGATDEETPIFLDFESIRIIKPGQYLLDLANLFSKDRPRIYQLEDGKYVIDLTSIKKQEEAA